MKTEDEIRQAVKEKYGRLASQGCCGDDPATAAEFEKKRGYTEEELSVIPAEANLGLGCGNPTALAPIERGMTVLDLGSGAGIDVFLAAQKVGPEGKVIGVDMTESMISKARENARKSNIQNVEFRLGEIETLPVDASTVDPIVSNCVINLSPDKDKVFAEAWRVLRPGGRLQISDIVTRGTAPERIRHDAELWAGCVSGALDKDVYIEKLHRAGFKKVDIVKEFQYDLPEFLGSWKSGSWRKLVHRLNSPARKIFSPRGFVSLAWFLRAGKRHEFALLSISLIATK